MYTFTVSNPFVQSLRTDKSARIYFDMDDMNQVGEAFKLSIEALGSFKLTLEPLPNEIQNPQPQNEYQEES
jgi:hypothetical protein